ncbi:MAG: hypothetical protein KDD62_11865 [Bdellovibrionales bacterium]|nr:hypothetical protein [Bdellovibrionales bacterium]
MKDLDYYNDLRASEKPEGFIRSWYQINRLRWTATHIAPQPLYQVSLKLTAKQFLKNSMLFIQSLSKYPSPYLQIILLQVASLILWCVLFLGGNQFLPQSFLQESSFNHYFMNRLGFVTSIMWFCATWAFVSYPISLLSAAIITSSFFEGTSVNWTLRKSLMNPLKVHLHLHLLFLFEFFAFLGIAADTLGRRSNHLRRDLRLVNMREYQGKKQAHALIAPSLAVHADYRLSNELLKRDLSLINQDLAAHILGYWFAWALSAVAAFIGIFVTFNILEIDSVILAFPGDQYFALSQGALAGCLSLVLIMTITRNIYLYGLGRIYRKYYQEFDRQLSHVIGY